MLAGGGERVPASTTGEPATETCIKYFVPISLSCMFSSSNRLAPRVLFSKKNCRQHKYGFVQNIATCWYSEAKTANSAA